MINYKKLITAWSILFCMILSLLVWIPASVSADVGSVVLLNRNLEIGMTGEDVKSVQERLISLGYLDSYADGFFGPITEAAVNSFQMANGMAVPDGQVGSWTLALLNNSVVEAMSPSGEFSDQSYYETNISDETNEISRILKIGMTGYDVRYIQERLIDLGYLNGYADEYYGPVTQAAVITFQRANGLAPDGEVGPWTYELLREQTTIEDNLIPDFNDDNTEWNGFFNYEPLLLSRVLEFDMYGPDVLELQKRLFYLGYMERPLDGYFGLETLYAVNNFQHNNGLNVPDGAVGKWTVDQLNLRIQEVINDSELTKDENIYHVLWNHRMFDVSTIESGSVDINPDIEMGMMGAEVYAVQEKLFQLGYLTVTPDGIFGPMTKAAVQSFQRDNGIEEPDGIVGNWTLRMLTGLLSEDLLKGTQITWIGDSLSAMAGQWSFDEMFPGIDYGNSFNNYDSYIQGGKDIAKETLIKEAYIQHYPVLSSSERIFGLLRPCNPYI